MAFVLLLVCNSISSASAHSTPIKATVLDEGGLILFNVETSGRYGESISSIMPQIGDGSIIQSNDKGIGVNLIWILTSVIVMIMTPVALMTYREEILTMIIKSNNQ